MRSYIDAMTTLSLTTGRIPSFSRGDRLRKARETAGYGSDEFAKLIGVSRSTVSNAEAERVALRTIVANAWSVATGVPVSWLIDGVETEDDVRVESVPRRQPRTPACPSPTAGVVRRPCTCPDCVAHRHAG